MRLAPHPCGRRCSRWRCTLLICSRSATAVLRVVSCWEDNRQSGQEMQTGALPDARTRTAGGTGERRPAPHAARGPGRTLRPDRPKHHRPTKPGVLPVAGYENKTRKSEERGDQPLQRATCHHSPGQVVTAVRSLPRPRPSRPVDTKGACPLSVLPAGRTTPQTPAKERPNKLGGDAAAADGPVSLQWAHPLTPYRRTNGRGKLQSGAYSPIDGLP